MKLSGHPRFLIVALAFTPLAFLLAAEPPATLTPPDSLMLDGVPPVPAEIAKQVGRYTESRAASFLDWHPNKPEMLILTRFGDTNQVHLVTQPGGARTQLTFFADRVNDASFDPRAGAFFVFSKSAGGNEFNQNYGYDLVNRDVTLRATENRETPPRPGATMGRASPIPRPGATAPITTFISNRLTTRRAIISSRK